MPATCAVDVPARASSADHHGRRGAGAVDESISVLPAQGPARGDEVARASGPDAVSARELDDGGSSRARRRKPSATRSSTALTEAAAARARLRRRSTRASRSPACAPDAHALGSTSASAPIRRRPASRALRGVVQQGLLPRPRGACARSSTAASSRAGSRGSSRDDGSGSIGDDLADPTGQTIGQITSCATETASGQTLALGYAKMAHALEGHELRGPHGRFVVRGTAGKD